MKYVKMLGLLAVAAAALMAFAGTAAATTITSPEGTPYTGNIVAASEGHVVLHGGVGTVECNSTVEGKVETHGTGVTAGGKIAKLTFSNCTGDNTVTSPVAKAGSLEIHWISGTKNGTLTSTGAEVVVTSHAFGGTCIYTTNGTHIGTVTGGNPATLDINSASIPRTGGTLGFFCGGSGTWTGSYSVSTPKPLYISH